MRSAGLDKTPINSHGDNTSGHTDKYDANNDASHSKDDTFSFQTLISRPRKKQAWKAIRGRGELPSVMPAAPPEVIMRNNPDRIRPLRPSVDGSRALPAPAVAVGMIVLGSISRPDAPVV